MSIFDLFTRKKRPCSNCGRIPEGLHRVFSGATRGEETGRQCTECIIERLRAHVEGAKMMFIEPMTDDGYCYFPFGVAGISSAVHERVKLALEETGAPCVSCSRNSRHIWMPISDLDEAAMEAQSWNNFWNIPSMPEHWVRSKLLCNEHILQEFREFIESRRFYFRTFRFPTTTDFGHYS